MAQNKIRVILLNKYDLADESETKKWKKYYEDKGYFTALVNSKSGKDILHADILSVPRQAPQSVIFRP